MRAEVTARMSSHRDLWDVDTLAYEGFERLYEKHLYKYFPAPPRFKELFSDDLYYARDFRPFDADSRLLAEL
eukprot:6648992-Alexandrium_andersonii.AAC.1